MWGALPTGWIPRVVCPERPRGLSAIPTVVSSTLWSWGSCCPGVRGQAGSSAPPGCLPAPTTEGTSADPAAPTLRRALWLAPSLSAPLLLTSLPRQGAHPSLGPTLRAVSGALSPSGLYLGAHCSCALCQGTFPDPFPLGAGTLASAPWCSRPASYRLQQTAAVPEGPPSALPRPWRPGGFPSLAFSPGGEAPSSFLCPPKAVPWAPTLQRLPD